MSDSPLNFNPTQQPESTDPVCPYCDQDPAHYTARGPFQVGPVHIALVMCGNPKCRKIWSAVVLGKVEAPKIIGGRFNGPGGPILTS